MIDYIHPKFKFRLHFPELDRIGVVVLCAENRIKEADGFLDSCECDYQDFIFTHTIQHNCAKELIYLLPLS